MRRVPKWVVGLLYVALALAFLAWYLARGHQAGDLGTVVSVFTGLLALPAAVIAVLHLGKNGPAPVRPEDVADQLAQGVRQQWEAEARVRRLNDPRPLSVEWEAADAGLVESWSDLRELAGDWSGQSPANSTWAVSPRGLAGGGGEIAQVFERVPTRRLVVLGKPGAGKTMLLIRLLLALLDHRPPGGPVPVLFPLASWDPARQDLYTWMAGQLAQDHPALRAPADLPQPSPGTQARALLEQRLILPILDGLDELPKAVHAGALHAINQGLPAGQPLVLSSRTDEYRRALTPAEGTTVLLNGAAGICLLDLDPAKAAAYLERDAGGRGTRAAARWNRVTASLGTGTPASEALSTPLGLFLARTIYNPRPDEHLVDLAHPDDLLRFRTREDIDAHLFSAFLPAAYRSHPRHPTRWTAQQAQRTLTFVARHLQHTLHGTPNLAWWQLPEALPKGGSVLAVGLIGGLAGGLAFGLTAELVFGFVFRLAAGRPFGLPAGLGFGLLAGLPCAAAAALITSSARERKPSSGIRWSWRGKSWLMAGLAAGLGFGLLFGLLFGLVNGPRFGLLAGLADGLAAGLMGGLMGGLKSVHPELDKAVGPGAILAQDRRTFSTITLAGGLMGALAGGLVLAIEPLFGYTGNLLAALAFGLAFGLPVGLVFGLVRSVWMKFLAVRIGLAALRRVPWRFMSFLADAHERRGVLRQVGAVYQFRHLDLQRHLAKRQP